MLGRLGRVSQKPLLVLPSPCRLKVTTFLTSVAI